MKQIFYYGILFFCTLFISIHPVFGNDNPEVEALFQESLESDNFEQNKANLEKIINLAPDSAFGHFSKGWFWAQEENYQMAVEEYRMALQTRPSFGEARNNLASAYFHLGRWTESIKEYEEVVREYPDWSETYLNLGSAYYMSGQSFPSVQAWETALQLNPGLSIVHYYLGLIFDKLDRKGEARFHYRQFLTADKDEEELSEYIEHASQRQTDLWIELGHDQT